MGGECCVRRRKEGMGESEVGRLTLRLPSAVMRSLLHVPQKFSVILLQRRGLANEVSEISNDAGQGRGKMYLVMKPTVP